MKLCFKIIFCMHCFRTMCITIMKSKNDDVFDINNRFIICLSIVENAKHQTNNIYSFIIYNFKTLLRTLSWNTVELHFVSQKISNMKQSIFSNFIYIAKFQIHNINSYVNILMLLLLMTVLKYFFSNCFCRYFAKHNFSFFSSFRHC